MHLITATTPGRRQSGGGSSGQSTHLIHSITFGRVHVEEKGPNSGTNAWWNALEDASNQL